MITTLVIFAVTCILLIISVLVFPEIKIKKISFPLYPFIALCGAVLLLIFTPLSVMDFLTAATKDSAVNPIKILTLFISLSMLSIFLDEAGFFEFFASYTLKKAGNSQKKLFIFLYAIVSILTIFTSNDIIILTFTPFIIYFCKNAKISSTPYLIAEFSAANTWSMLLIIGNPTNIYLATSSGIDFLSYVKVMSLPTVLSSLCVFATLFLMFRKKLSSTENCFTVLVSIRDKTDCILGVIMLFLCTLGLALSNFLHIEMWLDSVIFALVLMIIVCVISLFHKQKPIILLKTIKRAPWQLIPFVFSMFILVLGLDNVGLTRKISELLNEGNIVFNYGVTSFLMSNIINNIPMSVLYSSILSQNICSIKAVFASIVGSNIGALLTPVGALAGIMFTSITAAKGDKISNLTFIGCGTVISNVGLITCLTILNFIV